MQADYWVKQSDKNPCYPDLLWSRPENKALAGKLLIIGGNAHGFAAAANAYQETAKAGIGSARVLLPNSLQKSIGRVFEAGEYAPSTPAGSFAQSALADFVDMSLWADGVLVAGDVGRNSETAILLEQYLGTYDGPVTITKDAADLICQQPYAIMQRPKTLLVLSSGQLQHFATNARFGRAFTSTQNLLQVIENLHEFSKRFAPMIITKHDGTYIVIVDGQVSTTSTSTEKSIWRLETASWASTWWTQNPSKTFEALTTGIYSLHNQGSTGV